MPTADSFTALGKGNGFPFWYCIQKTDVTALNDQSSGEWHWTTLSGVNADNYTSFSGEELQAKVDQSLAYAMKLFWTRYKVTGFNASLALSDSYRSYWFHPEDGYSYSWNSNLSAFTDDDASSVTQPSERLCNWQWGDDELYKQDRFYTSYKWAEVTAGVESPDVEAFYDGDTLLGYALGYLNQGGLGRKQLYCIAKESSDIIAQVYLGNILFDHAPNHQNSDSHKRSFEYVTISGMHFVEFKEGYVLPLEDPPTGSRYSGQVYNRSVTLSPGSVSASLNYEWYYNAAHPTGHRWEDISKTAYASIDPSFDFYTF